MLHVKILCDSINPVGDRITTFLLRHNRFIHAEMLRHRVFSTNASSSRAKPVKTILREIKECPSSPLIWTKKQGGMSSNEEIGPIRKFIANLIWHGCRRICCFGAWLLDKVCKVHKQNINRLTEPWAHIDVAVTATEFNNFFNLRCHPAAQPEIQELAKKMLMEYKLSVPKKLKAGEWHIPFGDKHLFTDDLQEKLKIATARLARLSYSNFDGDFAPEKDYKLHDSLKESSHWSPFEHCAEALNESKQVGNFRGFKQYRKFFQGENQIILREELK